MTNVPPIPAELWDRVPPEAQAALLLVVGQYEARIRPLEARAVELERRLGRNSSNSSAPPSADPPSAPSPVVKRPTGRKTGGQPGHNGHSRPRLPEGRVDHVIPLVPDRCEDCGHALPAGASATDPEPTWHQVAELPRVLAVVTEFQGHARSCPCRRHVTRAAIPAEVTADAFGPRLAAALSYLAGRQHVSQRGLEAVASDLFGVPLSVGAVNALQSQVSAGLQVRHQEARAAAVKDADETSWKVGKRLRWLWVATTSRVSCFLIQAGRGRDQLQALPGPEPSGVTGSDRFSAYGGLPLGQRQLCWAHLKRDFKAIAERGGAAGSPITPLSGYLPQYDGERARHVRVAGLKGRRVSSARAEVRFDEFFTGHLEEQHLVADRHGGGLNLVEGVGFHVTPHRRIRPSPLLRAAVPPSAARPTHFAPSSCRSTNGRIPPCW
ncbi:MAG: IS66 family transposase [Gemmataceae bacterium]